MTELYMNTEDEIKPDVDSDMLIKDTLLKMETAELQQVVKTTNSCDVSYQK